MAWYPSSMTCAAGGNWVRSAPRGMPQLPPVHVVTNARPGHRSPYPIAGRLRQLRGTRGLRRQPRGHRLASSGGRPDSMDSARPVASASSSTVLPCGQPLQEQAHERGRIRRPHVGHARRGQRQQQHHVVAALVVLDLGHFRRHDEPAPQQAREARRRAGPTPNRRCVPSRAGPRWRRPSPRTRRRRMRPGTRGTAGTRTSPARRGTGPASCA